ncbi:MAG: hypothetical protein HYY93_01315 [Planctomycetes bacterium]|nr:hypothetical protein [Planctomycetota bacterium]
MPGHPVSHRGPRFRLHADSCLRVLVMILAVSAAAAAEEPSPCRVRVTSLDITRSRFEQETWIEAVIKNLGAEPLTQISVEAAVADSGGKEVRKFPIWSRPTLPARRALVCSVSEVRVPNFDQVTFTVTYTHHGSTHTFRLKSPSPGAPAEITDGEYFDPAKVSAAPGTALTLLEAASAVDPPPDAAAIRCWVRNESTEPARDAGVLVEGMDAGGAVTSRRFVAFGGDPIPPKGVAGFRLTVPGIFSDQPFTARIVQVKERPALDAGRLSSGAAVEAAEFAFLRLSDGTLVVRGTLRNGLKEAVRNVQCTVTLSGDAETAVPLIPPAVLAAGAVVHCETCLPEAPAFNGYGYDVAYDPASPSDTPAGPESFSAPVVERLPASEAPAAAGPKGPKPKKPAKAAKVRLAGIGDVEGRFTGRKKQMKYTGDVVFLVFAFEDEQGKPVTRQEGSVTVSFFEKKISRGTVTRAVTSGGWGLDASKLTSANARPETVAFQPHTQELWVGLLKMKDSDKFDDWTIDVTFTASEGPVWHWPVLEAPFLEDARGADR